MPPENRCCCGNNKAFNECCARFLNGGQQPKTPEQLMRSRYSAYALGGHGEYLLRTWFPPTAKNVTADELSRQSCDWYRLDVLNKSQTGDAGMVEFKAHFRDADGAPQVLHEKSVFARVGGTWFYVGGEVDA